MHPVAILYFGCRAAAAKAQLLYVHEPSLLGHGAAWPAARRRVVFGLLCAQALTATVMGLKQAPAQAALLCALVMPLTAAAGAKLGAAHDAAAEASPSLQLLASQQWADAEASAEESVLPFLHPALRPDMPPASWVLSEADELAGKGQRSMKGGTSSMKGAQFSTTPGEEGGLHDHAQGKAPWNGRVHASQ